MTICNCGKECETRYCPECGKCRTPLATLLTWLDVQADAWERIITEESDKVSRESPEGTAVTADGPQMRSLSNWAGYRRTFIEWRDALAELMKKEDG